MSNKVKLLEKFVHTQFPISTHMGFYIDNLLPNAVCVGATFEKNKNIHNTIFGGSIYSIGVLSGWIMVHHFLNNNNLNGDIFIKKAEINYNRPIDCNFIFKSILPNDEMVNIFKNRLKSHNKATIEIKSRTSNAGGKINNNVILIGHYTVISNK